MMYVRFCIVSAWLMLLAATYQVATNCGNCWSLGLFGLLLYGFCGITTLVVAWKVSYTLWRIK